MTIALLGIANIYNGFQRFMALALHVESEHASQPVQPIAGHSIHLKPKQKALRVLRISEQGDTPSCAGRMVISGKMADVCAELDRLVALESQNKPALPH